MNILAFDLGGSGGKLYLASVTDKKASVTEIHRFANAPCQVNNALYWDINHIYDEMNKGIKKAIVLTGDNIDSFAVDSFSNDFGFIDKEGALLAPVRCYRDRRTQRHARKIYEKLSKEELYWLSGNQNALFNTLIQLAALQEDGHGYLLKHAYKMLFIPDLLIHFLTGETIAEYTISSVSQMYDFDKRDWSQKILDTFTIPKRIFGTLTRPGVFVGNTKDTYNQQLGTKGFKVFTVCEHDTASAYLASPLDAGNVLISCGTWALIGTELDSPVITSAGYVANLANEGGFDGHHRLLGNVMSSWLIEECKSYYTSTGKDFSYEQLSNSAYMAKPFQYLFNPDDGDFFKPGNMPDKINAYCLKHYGNHPENIGELMRSIYESLALKFRYTIEQLETVTKKELPVINILGGGSNAEILCQFTANATEKKVVAGPGNASALGNITVQLIGTGIAANLSEAKSIMSTACSTKEYEPKDTYLWQAQYKRFKKEHCKGEDLV